MGRSFDTPRRPLASTRPCAACGRVLLVTRRRASGPVVNAICGFEVYGQRYLYAEASGIFHLAIFKFSALSLNFIKACEYQEPIKYAAMRKTLQVSGFHLLKSYRH